MESVVLLPLARPLESPPHDVNRNEIITSGALKIGETLFICIDSADDSATITSVDSFGATKTTGATPTDLLNGNTEVLGEGSAAVTIGTRPFASFFQDTVPLEVVGTVTLQVANNGPVRRRMVRILQSSGQAGELKQNGQAEEFEVKVEVEINEESSAPSAFGSSTGAVALLGAVAVAVM